MYENLGQNNHCNLLIATVLVKTEKLTVFACQLVSLKIEQSERIHKKEFNSPERAVFDVFAIYSTKKASRRLALEKFLS